MRMLRLAWRNVWRNKRRTGIVVTAVSIGIAGALSSVAFNYGMVVQMIETAIESELGHLQIHASGYDANPELARLIPDGGQREIEVLEASDGVRAFAPRVRSEGLLTSPRAAVGVRVIGIDPEKEAEVSLVERSIRVGRYLDRDRRRILIGDDLAKRLSVRVGDKVVVSAQSLSGDLSGEAMRVAGIFDTASKELDSGTAYLRIDMSQELLGLGEGISEIVVLADSRASVATLRELLSVRLSPDEVRSWEELRPTLVYLVDLFSQFAIYVYLAVFVAMAFGIANVLLMAVYERMREIGVLMALGVSRGRVIGLVIIESLLVTFLGLAIGFAMTLLLLYWLSDGIDLGAFAEGLNAYGVGTRIIPVLQRSDYLWPAAVALLTALLASAWPALRAARLRPAEAMRQS